MNSIAEVKPSSDSQGFSVRPGLHYFLTICIGRLVFDLFWGARVYDCLSSGNAYDCRYDIDRLKEMGALEIPSRAWSILHSLMIVLADPLVWLASFTIYAPI